MRAVIGMNPESKSRLTLWLRGERAFGLTAIPVPPMAEGMAMQAATAPVRVATALPALPMAAVATVSVASAAASTRQPPALPPVPKAPLPVMSPSPISLPVFDAPLLPREEKVARLQAMDESEVKVCTRCRLHSTRTNTVFGEGDPDAKIFFVGEGPGEDEDRTGRPFIGRSGQLLTKMIVGGMGLKREQVFIANIVKCRPPANRVPGLDEVAACTPYLERQIEIVRPKVIVTLGLPAATYMLKTKQSMGKLRGQWHSWRGIKLMPTYHPSYVLRVYTEEVRNTVWNDLIQVLIELKLPVPQRGG
jgi:DNA polymerase